MQGKRRNVRNKKFREESRWREEQQRKRGTGKDREPGRGERRNQCTGVSWKEGTGKEGRGSQQKRVGGRREKSEVTQGE